MILLTNPGTADKISVITGAAADIDVVAAYSEISSGFAVSAFGRQVTNIVTATTTDVVAGPASGAFRKVKHLMIRNAHASLACDVTVQLNVGGTLYEMKKATLQAGEELSFIEGVGWYQYTLVGANTLFKILTADDTGGQNVATAQPWFPTAGGVTVAAATTYLFDGLLHLTRSAGATGHTTSILFGGTATLTSMEVMAQAGEGDVATQNDSDITVGVDNTAIIVKSSSTSTTEVTKITVTGVVRVNAAGTFIPQFKYDVAPGGAPTTKRNSYFRMVPVGSNVVASQGTWA